MNRFNIGSKSYGIAAVLLFLSQSSFAVPVGIIDSGTDWKHKDLVNKAWLNAGETENGQDSDNNGYVDDIHGWNFADGNNEVIDYSFLGSFSPDVKKFFEIQLKMIEGTATPEELAWIQKKREDQEFIQELSTFANFVHGTHVAGIASNDAPDAQIMAAKIIPTKISPVSSELLRMASLPLIFATPESPMDDILVQGALSMIADQQVKVLHEVGEYIHKTKMKVANCSFGTGAQQAEMIARMIGQMILQRELNDQEARKYADFFMAQILEKGAKFVTASRETLYVMAAGNDGNNNDARAVFPANLKQDNTITVAATRGFDRIASFSNYGSTKVEIAAPGVGIQSSIPGDESMSMSGTSQAAPYVANLAGKVMDLNPSLSPKQVKEILVRTVDKKSFLTGKVSSGGIANEERALQAASLSRQLPLEEAIAQASAIVADVQFGLLGFQERVQAGGKAVESLDSGHDGEAFALPSLFQLSDRN